MNNLIFTTKKDTVIICKYHLMTSLSIRSVHSYPEITTSYIIVDLPKCWKIPRVASLSPVDFGLPKHEATLVLTPIISPINNKDAHKKYKNLM